jgi:hypothetical protein
MLTVLNANISFEPLDGSEKLVIKFSEDVMVRLRWKREAKETGLCAVVAAPRGYLYHDGDKRYATVSSIGGGWHGSVRGWYWVAGWDSDIPYMNTCGHPCKTPEEAKKQAAEYVAKHLT